MRKLALIPAAGRGARLDRRDTPKPLVEVGGQALIVRNMIALKDAGIERFVVVVGYRGDMVERAVRLHPALEGLRIEFVHNPDWERGLAASVLAARGLVDEPFVLAMADHVIDRELVWEMAGATLGDDLVVVLADRETGQVYDLESALKLSCEGDRVTGAGWRMERPDAIDCGILAVAPGWFDTLAEVVAERGGEGDEVGLCAVLDVLARQGKVRAVWSAGREWFDVDTPPGLIRAEIALRSSRRREAHGRLKSIPAAGPRPLLYTFSTGGPVDSRVFVRRDLVRTPHAIPLIPEDCASSPHFVFTDPRVDALYGRSFVEQVRQIGYDVHAIVLPEGEPAKTLPIYTRCVEQVLAEGIDECSIIISLGGGAVNNVAGFIASTLYRGIGLIHIPTTLMAQCDAAISHKQAVNSRRGKNLVGSYYAPLCIGVDVTVLSSLEDWRIPDGLAEVVKHALGQDAAYIDFLRDFDGDRRDLDFLETVVKKNIELKCALMRDDPKEHREGMVLQYGHTVGHPIEYLSGFELSHGQAIAIGMMVAVRVARILGACGDEMVELHESIIRRYGLPTRVPPNIDPDDVMSMLRYNKRYLTEGTRMALVDGPGSLWSVDGEYAIPVPDAELRRALTATY